MTRLLPRLAVSSLMIASAALLASCAGRAEAPAGSDSGASQLGTGAGRGARMEAKDAPPPAETADMEAPASSPVMEEEYYERGGDGALAKSARPGLGTAFGESRDSHVSSARFERADPRRPEVLFTLGYDNALGVDEMSRHGQQVAEWGWAREEDRSLGLAVTVLDEGGHPLRGATVDGRRYAIGEEGQRYTIGIENDSEWRYEAVVSVDGLDVIDGEEASLSKRGYIVAPYSSVVIDGWRTSTATVAAFRFSGIEDSYAERKGKGRNVGVLGAAFFAEDHRDRDREYRRRRDADPFPGG